MQKNNIIIRKFPQMRSQLRTKRFWGRTWTFRVSQLTPVAGNS